MKIVETMPERLLILDTDQGAELVEKVDDLKDLIKAFYTSKVFNV